MSEPSQRTAVREPKRAYQACIRCRGRKARCIVRDPPPGHEVTCLRCKRERKQCIFTAERTRKQGDRDVSGPIQSSPQGSANGAAWQQLPPSIIEPEASPNGVVDSGARRDQPRSNELTDRLTRTTVSNQTEALDLLFQAATEYRPNHGSDTIPQPHVEADGSGCSPYTTYSLPENWAYPSETLAQPSEEILSIFGKLKFVRKRWLTALEAVTFVRLFYKNLSSLSPIISDHYSQPSNFSNLVLKEPALCTVILTLSTRYHFLHGDGWLSRSYFLHNRLWRYCNSLLQRVIWGQERCVVSPTRNLGTVEGMLLMAEWHARSLHLPPDTEAWDSDDDQPKGSKIRDQSNIPVRWVEGVLEPLKRSDRMSWTLTQAAASLANELEVFDEAQDNKPSDASDGDNRFTVQRRQRLRLLLYVYINQLAFRTGYSALIPHNLLNITENTAKPTSQHHSKWLDVMSLSIDLTRLIRMSHDLLFSSKAATQDLILSGRYRSVLEHFSPLLENWRTKHSVIPVGDPIREILSVDFLYTRIQIYSLAVQAAAEQKTSQQSDNTLGLNGRFHYEGYEFIQGVIDGAKEVLRIVLAFAESGRLKFLPVRTYVRVIYICIFLLKALALGVPADQLNESLGLIDQSARVLRRHKVDDLHLAGVFASLLEAYTKGFRSRFVSVTGVHLSVPNAAGSWTPLVGRSLTAMGRNDDMNNNNAGIDLGVEYDADNGWFAHPFDSSIAPFGIGFTQPFGMFDDLSFMWDHDV